VTGDLTIAIPRGALFRKTLDLLDALGIDTADIRGNDRRLVFPGVLTVRPSDVPTYVEHGAADLGITGKDVLVEQSEREVYELADLGYGHCRMVVAAPVIVARGVRKSCETELSNELRRRSVSMRTWAS